jgi:hypothetical protein
VKGPVLNVGTASNQHEVSASLGARITPQGKRVAVLRSLARVKEFLEAINCHDNEVQCLRPTWPATSVILGV